MTTTPLRKRRVDPDAVAEEKTPWEDDTEEAPAPRRKRRPVMDDDYDDETGEEEASGEEVIIPTYKGADKIKSSRPSEGGNIFLKWPDSDGEGLILKFIPDEDGDVAWSYNSHWVTRAGKQSFPCAGSKCPLCAIGVKVSQKIVYSVLNLSIPDPIVQALEVTPTVHEDLLALDGGKSGPLSRLWWEAARPKKTRPTGFSKYNYTFTPIKDRDLEEDYGMPLDEAESLVKKAKPITSKALFGKITMKTLQEIADEVMD